MMKVRVQGDLHLSPQVSEITEQREVDFLREKTKTPHRRDCSPSLGIFGENPTASARTLLGSVCQNWNFEILPHWDESGR